FGPKKMMVTAATGARQNLPARAYAALDRIHVMSYDHGGKHSTLEQAKADVKFLLDKKVPAEKICLGMPFYGRNTKGRKESRYRKLVQDNHPAADVDEVAGVYFNGIKTIQEKTRYAKENGLAGVMIWELGEDTMDETSLLRAIGEVVGKK